MSDVQWSDSPGYPPRPDFPSSDWGAVKRVKAADSEELEQILRSYRLPLYAWIRTGGIAGVPVERQEARDCVMSFFPKQVVRVCKAAKRERGKFRDFLKKSFKHHVLQRKRAGDAIKRGGGLERICFDETDAYLAEKALPSGEAFDDLLDCALAKEMVDYGRKMLEQDFIERGKRRSWEAHLAYSNKEAERLEQLGYGDRSAAESNHRRVKERIEKILPSIYLKWVLERDDLPDDPVQARKTVKELLRIYFRQGG